VKSNGVRVAFCLVVAAAVAGGPSFPAHAKGAIKAVITGPGISSPITLRESDSATGSLLAAISDESGFMTVLGCGPCQDRLRHRPIGQLGPRYTMTYTMMLLPGASGARTNEVVQYVYPLAVPRPVTYIPPGQRFWRQATMGGWFVGGLALRLELQEVGVPLPAALTQSGGPSGAAASNEAGSWSMRTLIPLFAAFLLIVFLVVTLVARLRRPRDRKKGVTVRESKAA